MHNHISLLAKPALLICAIAQLPGCGGSGASSVDSTPQAQKAATQSNSTPIISGSPPTAIRVGDSYDFRPSASDADGDSLVFSIENMPDWASFESNSGRLSGSPTAGDEGQYRDIRIEVSDGKSRASLTRFDIVVTQVGNLAVTLNWIPPTENQDGSPLTDLAGYVIYYGSAARNYDYSIRADNPGLSSFTVDGLLPGTYYFAAAAYSQSGAESRLSGEIVVQLN